jgi:hypothetical protein
MPNFDAMRLAMSLCDQLLALTEMVDVVVREQADPRTPPLKRDELHAQEMALSHEITRLYPAFEAANKGKVLLKVPDPALVKRISTLSDDVQTYIKGQTATDRTLVIVGSALALAQQLTAA